MEKSVRALADQLHGTHVLGQTSIWPFTRVAYALLVRMMTLSQTHSDSAKPT
jgi:hypothetical protein